MVSRLYMIAGLVLCGLLWIGICRINTSWKKIALDAIGIADAYLDMVLFSKASIGIKWMPLPEYTFHGIISPFVGILVDKVDGLNNRAVQLANKFVRRGSYVSILWKCLSCPMTNFNKDVVGILQLLQICWICQVKTIAQINDCPYNSRLLDRRAFALRQFRSPLQGSCLIVLPEIDAITQPVVIIRTGDKVFFTVHDLSDHRLVASVETDNKVGTSGV